ncbi:DUF4097 family beta strand repeat-containing protein [Actinomadura oligospora]|uniref:DUF4097 family beta strand repeat-containing protein n=1 Tax=Actinomadura oligospora TaxID=111804 RepID=UPI0004AEEBAB|nr:DUF4097 family beta strand repeat-containing protein [Actinomadura oligospora]
MATRTLPVRTLTAPGDGPVLLGIFLPDGVIETRTEPGREVAEVTLTATSADPALADALEAAKLTWNANRHELTVVVPIVSTGVASHVHVEGTSMFAAVNTGTTNGITIDGDSISEVTSTLQLTARLPERSGIVARTRSADLDAHGTYKGIKYDSLSGALTAGNVQWLLAETMSGDISADITERVQARSTSGDVRIGRTLDIVARSVSGDLSIGDYAGPTGAPAGLSTTSGDIALTATGPGTVTARSATGSIDISAGPRLAPGTLTVDATSDRGRVRTPGAH